MTTTERPAGIGTMPSYYKATRPNGTDFRTGRIDYAAALASGEVIRHPAKKVRNEPETYLSVSVSPSDCTGFSWPCRLFRVKPVGRVMSNLSAGPNKRAVSALRVVEELPAWQALGPNGEAVAAFIERAGKLTPKKAKRLAAAGAAAWPAARAAAWDAAGALVISDLITAEQFDILTKPWRDAGLELP